MNIDHKSLKNEKDFLKALRVYIDSRLHPKVICQLEVMCNRQKQGDSILNVISQQATNFYEAGMDKNTPDEWLVLLSIPSIDEAPTLTEIFKRAEEIKTYSDINKIAQSVESGC